ncbi:MAG: hypothetical protein JO248_18350, partial [Acidimicrobiia bacterium]|nr:hypothetical protein [Acidimicrobiia bacterium]
MGRRLAIVLVACAVLFGACGQSGKSVESLGSQRRQLLINDQPTPLCLTLAATLAQQNEGLSDR